MDKVFEQTFSLADILPAKNYSRISDRRFSTNTFMSDIDDIIDLENFTTIKLASRKRTPNAFITPFHEKSYKNSKFFFNEKNGVTEKIELFPPNKNKIHFYTTKERHIKKFFPEPFTRISVDTFKRLIYRSEDKVVIKVLHKSKIRNINWKFFKENMVSTTVSFNLKTGNFIIITQNGKGTVKGTRTMFRTNSFEQLKRLFSVNNLFFPSDRFDYTLDEKVISEFKKVFNDNEFIRSIYKEVLNIDNLITVSKEGLYPDVIEDFIKKRGIKVPNKYLTLLECYYPKSRILKKNDNKLIQGILDMYGIKCKSTIKLLHEVENINLGLLVRICQLFGDDYYHYISRIDKKVFELKNSQSRGDKYSIGERNFKNIYPFTKDEKDNLLNVVISLCDSHDTSIFGVDSLIKDHVDMITKVKKYFPETRFNCRTRKEFDDEHVRLSTIISAIRKGWTLEYQFDEKMLNDVESEITAVKDEFSLIKLKPFILKREEEYNEEGRYMHHCVAGYVTMDKSIIVSLRTLDGEDRVTCEFNIQNGKVLQKRHFCNRNPPDHFIDGLQILETKIEKYARWGLLNWKEKKKVPVIVNGVEIIPEKKEPTRPDAQMIDVFDFNIEL